jgi:hypothetical protein
MTFARQTGQALTYLVIETAGNSRVEDAARGTYKSLSAPMSHRSKLRDCLLQQTGCSILPNATSTLVATRSRMRSDRDVFADV